MNILFLNFWIYSKNISINENAWTSLALTKGTVCSAKLKKKKKKRIKSKFCFWYLFNMFKYRNILFDIIFYPKSTYFVNI